MEQMLYLDYYRIMVGGDDIKIISLPQLKIIKSINNQSICWVFVLLKMKVYLLGWVDVWFKCL